jgi:serine/threonine protein kinase
MREQKGLKTSNVGTPYYMAPELIKSSLYDEKVDIWAFGLIFYEKLRGWPMFKGI